jgi:ubiquinone/menaquinone biosynthesis C-methylase UbiE
MAVRRSRLLTFAFGLLYNQLAWTYDSVSWTVSMGQWRSWQRCALPFLRGPDVLEVAHGTGDMLIDGSAAGFRLTGLDLSPAMTRRAQRKLRRQFQQPADGRAPPLLRGRVEALPFSENTFSSLLSTFPSEFIADAAALAEFFRILQPGGAVVCVPAAYITGKAINDRLAAWLFRITGQSSAAWTEPLLARFESAGFTTRLTWVHLARSRVAVIVAEKPRESDDFA